MKTPAKAQAAQNDLKRLCQLWVREHHPQVYRRFQEAIGLTPRQQATSRLVALMDKAMDALMENKVQDEKEACHDISTSDSNTDQ